MNALGAIASEFFRWVLQTTWQAAVLAGLILLTQRLFRKRLSPAWRYGLWLLLVVRLLIPVPPQSAFSIFNLARIEPFRTRLGVASSPSRSPMAPTAPAEGSSRDALSAADTPQFPATTGLGGSQVVAESSEQGLSPRPATDWHGVAVQFWLVGACVFGLRLVWSDARFRRRLARCVPVSEENVTGQFEECLEVLGIRRRVTLIETEE